MTDFPIVAELRIDDTWVDVTGRLRGDEIVLQRGRSDEAITIQPAQTSLQLDNVDGFLTPGNARSPWYPFVKRGMPVRISKPGGAVHLLTDGAAANRAFVADHASFDVTDLWVAAEVALDDWNDFENAKAISVVDRWGSAGNRSWQLTVFGGVLFLIWSTDGTATLTQGKNMVPMCGDGRMAVAAHLDVNNGVGGHTVTFYAGRRLDDLEQMGDPIVVSGVTSVHPGSAGISIGGQAFDDQGFRCYKAQVRNGDSSGTIVVNPDFTAQTVGATSFADSAGRTWSVQGTARLDDTDVRFTGQADRIELAWPKAAKRDSGLPQAPRAIIDASVSLRRMLQGNKPLNSTLRRYVASPSVSSLVVDYWPHEDGRDARVVSSGLPGGKAMRIRGDYQMAADDTLDASSPVLTVASGENAFMSAPIRHIPRVAGVEWEVTRFFRIDEPVVSPATPTQLMAVDTDGSVATWRISIDDTQIGISGVDPDGSGVVLDSFPSDDRFFNTWAMIILEVVDDGSDVDWAVSLIPIPLGSVFGTSDSFSGSTGVPNAFRNSLTGPPSGVSVGHLIVTSGAPIGWLAGTDTAWVGETATHRFFRLLNEEQIPMSIMGDPDVGGSTRGDGMVSELMGPQRPAPLLELLQECVSADGGRLMERRDTPGLCFRTRQSMYNQTAAITLDAAAAGLREPFAPTLDDQRYRNEVSSARVNGGEATVTTDPPPDPGDRYDDAVTLNVQADTQLPSQAGWRLHLASTETLRYPGLSTSMGRSGQGSAWSEADVGDLVEVTNLMDQMDLTDRVLIEGSREVFDFYRWIVEINGSPAAPWTVAVREESARDTAGSVLDAAFDAGTDTTLDVETTLGPLWTTDGDDMPFDISVGGAQVTVTAIGAPSGQVQTFTVSTTIGNGVDRAIPAGSEVRLWQPAIRAL